MPRIRSVKPEFWADEAVARLPRDARLLFLGMLNFADDHGRMRGSPLLIRAQVFPYDTDLDVSRLLASLREAGFIRQYEAGEQAYIQIRGFLKHQKIDHPSKALFPEPPPEDTNPREPSRALIEDSRKISLDQGTGIREQGEEKRLASLVPAEPAPPPTPFTTYALSAFPTCKNPHKLEARAKDAWPGVDITGEAKKARVWEETNPTRIKKNKAAFLARWFDRAQEQRGGMNGHAIAPQAPTKVPSPIVQAQREAARAVYLRHKAEQEAAERELAGRKIACKA